MTVLKSTLLALVCLGVVLAPAAFAKEPPALDTQKKKISYVVGQQMGESLARSGLDIDLDVFAASIADALAGKPNRLSDEELKATYGAIQMQTQQHQVDVSKANQEKGEKFLAANAKKEGVKVLPSGLQYKVVSSGSGKTPGPSDSVTVNYRGTLIDGTEFDSSYSRNKPITFPVNGVIKGWTEALQLMKEGDKWQLFIPSNLAYGSRGAGGKIGPNETLVFDVELITVNGAPTMSSPK